MRTMLMLLIVLMISLSLSACCPPLPEPTHVIQKVYHVTDCGQEIVPNYVQLDPDKHIGSSENVNVLISNLEGQNGYIEGLNKIIGCYEKQKEKNGEIAQETIYEGKQ